jgi:tRNA A-37 threonylcarbamoyl transferase component Bud32
VDGGRGGTTHVVEPARSILGNRYELAGLLATGGMGQVWRAADQLLGRPVAVKVLRSEYTGDPLFRARFRAEAHHAAALSHPNIAAVYDYGEETAVDGSGECLAYLVMELVEGESLSALLSRGGALSPARTLEVLRQTAGALGAAHAAGVVHRDVKPGNVLVSADGTVKITDFGIAWSAGSVPLTQTGQVIGTAAYLSPEQAAGSHATAASDVYSLGMVGYECLTGRKAFDGENSVAIAVRQLRDQPEPLPPEVPAGIRSLIDHALVKDPVHRIPDGAAFVAAIDDVLAGAVLPPVAHPDTLSFWLVPGGATGSTGAGSSATRGTDTNPAAAVVAAPARGPARQRLGRVLVPVAALLLGAGIAGTVVQQVAAPSTAGVAPGAVPSPSGSSTGAEPPSPPVPPSSPAGAPPVPGTGPLEVSPAGGPDGVPVGVPVAGPGVARAGSGVTAASVVSTGGWTTVETTGAGGRRVGAGPATSGATAYRSSTRSPRRTSPPPGVTSRTRSAARSAVVTASVCTRSPRPSSSARTWSTGRPT